MEYNAAFKEEYLDNWPKNYYLLSPRERLCALQEQLKRQPDSADDLRRKELFELRYDSSFNDRFMNAWMMLKAADASAPSFLLKRKYRKDVLAELAGLGISEEEPDRILKEEWTAFADFLIKTYLASPSFRSAVFGMGSVGDRNACLRLADEIRTVTKTVPARADAEAMVQAFRTILKERFIALIPDGASMIDQA